MPYNDGSARTGFSTNELLDIIDNSTNDVKTKLAVLQGKGSTISIGDMFEMQMLMNHLSQLSEMTSSVVSAANSSIQSMARNVKS